MLEKCQHLDPIEKGMIMEMIGSQEAWAGTIILQVNPLEELMQVQGRGASQVSVVMRQRRRIEENILQGELKKIKTLTLNGENRKGEEDEAWLLEMKIYFHLHDYPSRVEAIISTDHL